MNIPLKKHQAEWIAEQVRTGRYASEIEAIEDALREGVPCDEVAAAHGLPDDQVAEVDYYLHIAA